MSEIRSQNRRKKEYLSQYRHLIEQQKRLEQRMDEIRLEYMMPGVKESDGMPHAHSSPHDLSDYIVKYDEVLDMLRDVRMAKLNIIRDIEMRIEAIKDPTERSILELRYLEGFTLQQAADILGYSFDRIRHKHGDALQSFQLDTP